MDDYLARCDAAEAAVAALSEHDDDDDEAGAAEEEEAGSEEEDDDEGAIIPMPGQDQIRWISKCVQQPDVMAFPLTIVPKLRSMVLEPLRMPYTGSCVAHNRQSKCHQKLPLLAAGAQSFYRLLFIKITDYVLLLLLR
jgi:hypothetical protein